MTVIQELIALAQLGVQLHGTISKQASQAKLTASSPPFEPSQFASTLYGQLERKNLARHAGQIQEFVRSEEGIEALRVICSSALVGGEGNAREKRIESTAALISLHARSIEEWHEEAARILDIVIISHIGARLRRARNSASWRAEAQRHLISGSGTRNADRDRPSRIRSAISTLPPDYRSRIHAYCEQVVSLNSTIVMPTLRDIRESDIDTGYVPPSIRHGGGGNVDDLLEHISTVRRLALIGAPGAGKSTAVQVAMRSAALTRIEERHGPVPIQVTMRHFEPLATGGIFRFILEELQSSFPETIDHGTLKYILHTGQVLLFCDGFDEILEISKRRKTAEILTTFCMAFPGTNVLLTSRPAEYDQAHPKCVSGQAEVEPFGFLQIKQYATNFFCPEGLASAPALRGAMLESFLNDIHDSLDLASNPLMLGVMCALYEAGRTIPINRFELYEACATMLFSAWDRFRDIGSMYDREEYAQEAVMLLAHTVYVGGQEEFPADVVDESLVHVFRAREGRAGAAALQFTREVFELWRGRRWMLLHVGSREGIDYFRFSHRTFLEHFAALYVSTMSESFEFYWEILKPRLHQRDRLNYLELVLQSSRKYAASYLESALVQLSEDLAKMGDRAGRSSLGHSIVSSIVDLRLLGRFSTTSLGRSNQVLLDALHCAVQELLGSEWVAVRSREEWLNARRIDTLKNRVSLEVVLAFGRACHQPRGALLSFRDVIPDWVSENGPINAMGLGRALSDAARMAAFFYPGEHQSDRESRVAERAFFRWLSSCLQFAASAGDGSAVWKIDAYARELLDKEWSEESLSRYLDFHSYFSVGLESSSWAALYRDESDKAMLERRLAVLLDDYVVRGRFVRSLRRVAIQWASVRGGMSEVRYWLEGAQDEALERYDLGAQLGAAAIAFEMLRDGQRGFVEQAFDESGSELAFFRSIVGSVAGWMDFVNVERLVSMGCEERAAQDLLEQLGWEFLTIHG